MKQRLAKNCSLKSLGINKKGLVCPAISSKMTCSKSAKKYEQKLLEVKCLIQNQDQILILSLIQYQTLIFHLNLILSLNLILVQCL